MKPQKTHLVQPLLRNLRRIVADASKSTETHPQMVLSDASIVDIANNPPNSLHEFTHRKNALCNTPFLRSSRGKRYRDQIVDACINRKKRRIVKTQGQHYEASSSHSQPFSNVEALLQEERKEGADEIQTPRRSSRSSRRQTHQSLMFGRSDTLPFQKTMCNAEAFEAELASLSTSDKLELASSLYTDWITGDLDDGNSTTLNFLAFAQLNLLDCTFDTVFDAVYNYLDYVRLSSLRKRTNRHVAASRKPLDMREVRHPSGRQSRVNSLQCLPPMVAQTLLEDIGSLMRNRLYLGNRIVTQS